eukprot:gene12589-biopygen10327
MRLFARLQKVGQPLRDCSSDLWARDAERWTGFLFSFLFSFDVHLPCSVSCSHFMFSFPFHSPVHFPGWFPVHLSCAGFLFSSLLMSPVQFPVQTNVQFPVQSSCSCVPCPCPGLLFRVAVQFPVHLSCSGFLCRFLFGFLFTFPARFPVQVPCSPSLFILRCGFPVQLCYLLQTNPQVWRGRPCQFELKALGWHTRGASHLRERLIKEFLLGTPSQVGLRAIARAVRDGARVGRDAQTW